jgi:hypothetical protein
MLTLSLLFVVFLSFLSNFARLPEWGDFGVGSGGGPRQALVPLSFLRNEPPLKTISRSIRIFFDTRNEYHLGPSEIPWIGCSDHLILVKKLCIVFMSAGKPCLTRSYRFSEKEPSG